MTLGPEGLPAWMTWQQCPFPDANLLLLEGAQSALVDSAFVGHAEETARWVRERTGRLELVVNTHWHSDHVGGNALLQAAGAGIAASAPDAEAVNGRDPGCCVAEYPDQPVAPYGVDIALHDGQVLKLGEADWEVIGTPGHTPATSACGSLTRGRSSSGTPCRRMTSAGSTSRSTGRRRLGLPWRRCTGW